ncbi:cytochrome C552 [Myroides ceti]|uniref:Cytochrome C552 n=1 Tax=Paenimyroides ceti TaxID=395087 RepID=A0ABT8D1P5_9FLAO|nr:cytochrome C552 [Paenimyroides ceti]MDN3710251.1 cytochrome C552 [Paenimyroides ceti]
MKFFMFSMLALSFLGVSCNKEEKKSKELYPEEVVDPNDPKVIIEQGKELFNSNKAACYTCHLPDKKSNRPSIQEIAKIYQEKNGDMFAFLRQKAETDCRPRSYDVMKANFAIIKTFSDEEVNLRALHKKPPKINLNKDSC